MDEDLTDRLARLEREMAILRAEFARLREHTGAPVRPATARQPETPPPESPRPAPRPRPEPPKTDATGRPPMSSSKEPRRTLEEMIGRYATIATATVTVLVGVGIFLTWAIQHALLGPTTRVVLGYLIALAVAAGGVWLRMRGTREFGNVLLAMALGVVHLVSWSAGPLLQVIPSWAALVIGALASAILAEFALRHEEETLCAIGFGGAAIAPFVLGDSDGNKIVLALYGLVVVGLGAAALRMRTWRVARRVTIGSFFLYTVTSGLGDPASSPPAAISLRLWVLFPLAALLAFVPLAHSPQRRMFVRVAVMGLIVGGVLRAQVYGPDHWTIALMTLGAIAAIGVLDLMRPGALERERDGAAVREPDPFAEHSTLIDAFLVPVGLFFATVVSAPLLSSESAAIAVLWTLAMVWMTHRTRAEPDADPYAFAASLIAMLIVPSALGEQLGGVVGKVALAIVLMITAMRMNRRPFIAGTIAALVIASGWALLWIVDLPSYRYSPFMTRQTLACVVAAIGWFAAARIARREGFLPNLDRDVRRALPKGLIVAGTVTAFLWGVGELKGAWNPSASTALLIVYYAATGTLMIWLGRSRDVRPLRLGGLMLSLWAAWSSLGEAFSIPNVAVRISVFFAVSAFLIAVAYWYRQGAGDDAVTA